MDWDTVVAGVIGVLGGGVGKAVVDGYNARRTKLLDLQEVEVKHENAKEDTAISFLREALKDEREAHAHTLQRLTAIENDLKRREDEWSTKHEECRAENKKMQKHLDVMREALLASFLGDRERAMELVEQLKSDSVPPPAP